MGRDVLIRDITGRSESIIATLAEMVRERLITLSPAGYARAGYAYVEPWRRLENQCCRLGAREAIDANGAVVDLTECPGHAEGAEPREGCWSEAWARAGRPMPIPEWEAAGRPDRKAWTAGGGRFSYDALDRWYFDDCTCEHANGGPKCRRLRCYDCRSQSDDWSFAASADLAPTAARMSASD